MVTFTQGGYHPERPASPQSCRTAERLPHLALLGLGPGPSLEQLLELDVRRCLTVLKLSSALAAPVLPLATVVQAWARVVGTIMHWAGKAPIVDAAIALVPGLEAMSRVLGNGELERLIYRPAPP